MTGVAILLQVLLLTPQPPGPEAQPHPARRNVGLQSNQPVSKIGQPPPLLVNLLPPTLFRGLRNRCAARTADTLPSSDTRTALNSRAGIPCSLMYSRFSGAADRPAATSANSLRSTWPYNSAQVASAASPASRSQPT